jgi:hypothetical protein|uniref:Pyocin activator protein PrtN n=1 Tax=Siphoviridae sp. ct6bb17 TaxID=2825345 RepID=A0A8S5NXW2_9CAUD|nr:MAG TPA: Pyocin activator protein PrtN [Siphoviridae sp. ct6bb17]
MPNRMTVDEAARLMGCSSETVRLALIKEVLPFGFAVKRKSKYTFVIFRKKFEEFTGIDSCKRKEKND